MKKVITLVFVFSLVLSEVLMAYIHPALFKFDNTSDRFVEVKLMKMTGDSMDEASVYRVFSVDKGSIGNIEISETGKYYFKTKGVRMGAENIYGIMTDVFNVYVGIEGYSVLTVTYSVEESNIVNSTNTVPIDEYEYNKN
jgi:hypothetical protein